MEEDRFRNEYMVKTDEVIKTFNQDLQKAKAARILEFEKGFANLRKQIVDLLNAFEDSIDEKYDEMERAAMEKCEKQSLKYVKSTTKEVDNSLDSALALWLQRQ